MEFLIAFLEGIITFLSPCLLPMIPVYLSYFAGGGERTVKRTLLGVSGFITGFTVVFVALGALAGTVGGFLKKYDTVVDIVTGLVVVFFGLYFLGIFKFTLFKGHNGVKKTDNMGFFPAALFGIVFSLGWTPCVGAFLGSALALASQAGHILTGMGMLLAYSLGLGVPFLISAVLIDQLKGAFTWIKRNYKFINIISGSLLILMGIAMATGLMDRLLQVLS